MLIIVNQNSKTMRELIFQTCSGVKLYAVVNGDTVTRYETSNWDEVLKALKEDLYSSNFIDRNMAAILLLEIAAHKES